MGWDWLGWAGFALLCFGSNWIGWGCDFDWVRLDWLGVGWLGFNLIGCSWIGMGL